MSLLLERARWPDYILRSECECECVNVAFEMMRTRSSQPETIDESTEKEHVLGYS